MAFFFALLIASELITWIIVRPNTPWTRIATVLLGLVVFVVALVLMVIAVGVSDYGRKE
jgi:glucan phosphoethanolaminetransferase (alkaline phosphatase superfamily)